MIRQQIFVSDSLLVALKELKAAYRYKWNELFIHLNKVTKPTNFQSAYNRAFDGKNKRQIDIRLEEQTIINFNTIAAYFRSKEDCLDYLIDQEKNEKMRRPFTF